MRPLKLEQSDATKQNETTKPRTIRCNKQRMRPLEQSDTLNRNKTKNDTTKTRTIKYNEQKKN